MYSKRGGSIYSGHFGFSPLVDKIFVLESKFLYKVWSSQQNLQYELTNDFLQVFWFFMVYGGHFDFGPLADKVLSLEGMFFYKVWST